jgi:hypothetical protein
VADGAHRDVVKRATHPKREDTADQYLEIYWGSLCAEIAKLRIYGRGVQLSLF